MKQLTSLLAALVLAAAPACPAHAAWHFEGLGTLGGDSSKAFAVSADGSVVAGESSSAQGRQPFRWENGTMSSLGPMPPWPYPAPGQARDVSADGSVVVGHAIGRWPTNYHAFRWESGEMVDLGPYDPRPMSQAFAWAHGVSADGSVVVGQGRVQDWSDDDWYDMGYRWTEQEGEWVRRPLGTLGGESSRAYAVSADGSVIVGSSENAAGHWEAFRWENHQMTSLGALGSGGSYAEAASADGSVIVGYSYGAGGAPEAFRWEDGVMVGLGTPGGEGSGAIAVTADGSVVLGGSYSIGSFIWNATDGMRSLREMFVDHGIDLSGWDSIWGTDFSADGKVIVGSGITAAGNTEAWRAVVPEPSTLALLCTFLAAGAVWLRRNRRKRQ